MTPKPITHEPSTPSIAVSALPLRAADLRGLAQLGIDAALGITQVVESMHHTISPITHLTGRMPPGKTAGITGAVYGAVRGTTRAVGKGLDLALGAVAKVGPPDAGGLAREAMISALNGVWGDHLVDTANPLAIPMTLRRGGQALDLSSGLALDLGPRPGARLLVLVHGLCMNDLQWSRNGHDHGQALAADLGLTPVYLHYNTGLHVSQNGRDFARLLDQLVAAWPVPVEELMIVGHSMGGLVTRSACHLAEQSGAPWLKRLSKVVCLGTPHHGAPLERGGHLVSAALGLSPYVEPFAGLAKARSAGITDLRYGNVQDADWQGRDRHSQSHDDRKPTPLPGGVTMYLVAATTGDSTEGLRSKLLGDGLVPLASALGEHDDPARCLPVPGSQRLIVTGCNHLALLDRQEVYQQLRRWLGATR